MNMGRMAIFIFLIACLAMCQTAAYPPKPFCPKLMDIPGDAGTNVIVRWRHFETTPGIRYDILRSEDGSKFDVISPLQTKSITYEDQSSPENDFSALDYYLTLIPQDNDLPMVKVIKATEQNRDSLISIGAERIIRVEVGVPPRKELEKLPEIFALGEYYRIIPDTLIAMRSQAINVPKTFVDPIGLSINTFGEITLEITPDESEIAFAKKGKQILAENEEKANLVLKYGKQIVSFVTDKARYTVKNDILQFIDKKSDNRNLEPGKKYYYKVRLYQVDKPIKQIHEDSDVAEIIPQDEPPVLPGSIQGLYDSAKRELVLSLQHTTNLAVFFDNATYTIFKTTPKDTLRQAGVEILKVASSWEFIRIQNVDTNAVFYVVVEDLGGKKTTSGLIVPQPVVFSDVPIPENLRLVDNENDEGKKTAIRWGPPMLAAGYSVKDAVPKIEKIDVSNKNIYIIPEKDGNKLAIIEKPEDIVPGSSKVLQMSFSVPGAKKDIEISYQMRANAEDRAAYGEFSLDGMRKIDKDNTGIINFRNIDSRKYRLQGKIVTSSGSRLKNPEAILDIEVDATQTRNVPIPSSPYMLYILRGTDPNDLTTFSLAGVTSVDAREFIDDFGEVAKAKGDFYYIIQVIDGETGSMAQTSPLGPISMRGNWFHSKKLIIFFALIIFVGVALFFVYHAKKGRQFYIRPIAGIVHIDEALGRATEMGKPIIYVPGLGYIEDIATISAMTILGRVARKAAEYQNDIFVPCYDPIVMIVAQETVRNAFMDAKRPDLYKEEHIYYAAPQQFAYAAAVSGLMIREKSAANFFMGRFYAESLILAETGSSTGAIQVAGTDDMTQLPFFITACDYTLIGEELYAASAYLSTDPMQKGSLKAQDFLKAVEMVLLVIGTIAASAGMWWFTNIFKATGVE